VRTRGYLAAALITAAVIGMSWGAVSAAAVPTDTPTPTSTGSSQVGFTVVDTASPTPTPTSSTGGGSGGSGGSGGGSGGGTTPPVCVPSTKAPSLAVTPVKPSILRLTPKRASQGQDVLVQGDGFQAGEKVVLGLLPTPVSLGTFTVRTNGQIYAEVTIPKRTQLGSHAIVAIGFLDCHIGLGALDVVSPRGSGSSMFPWIVWVIAGSTLGLAGVGILIAFLLGWLPLAGTTGVATRAIP
jgi:hypothetical protein